MKEIRAYVKPHKLGEVILALHYVQGLTGMTVLDARGFGRGHAKHKHETSDDALDYVPCARIELFCQDDIAETVISTIQQHAHTGLRGDGKIYVLPVEQAVRISSGERGETAV